MAMADLFTPAAAPTPAPNPGGGGGKMSDLFSGGAPTAPASSGRPSGGSMSALFGGGGGGTNQASPPPAPVLPAPQAAAPAHHGGGGLLGSIGRVAGSVGRVVGNAAGDVNNLLNPVEEVKNAGRLANATLTQTTDLGRGIGGELTGLAHGKFTEQYVPAHLRPGFQPRDASGNPVGHPIGSNPATFFMAHAPLVGQLGEMGRQAGEDVVVGPGQGALGALGVNAGHGFSHAAEQAWYHHPIQTPVNAALLAAAVGGGVGALGEATGAEGLANAGRAVQGVATPVARLPFATLGGVGEAGGALAERLGAAPGGAVSQMARGGLLGKEGVARTAVSDLAARQPITEGGLAQKVQQTAQRARLEGLLRENDINRAQEQTNTTRVDRLSQQAVGADPAMEKALNLRLTGHGAVYEPILSAAEKAGVDPAPILAKLGVDEHTANLVTGRGTPVQEAALREAEGLQRPMAQTRFAEEIAGRGGRPLRDEAGNVIRDQNGQTLTRAIHPEQAGTVTMPHSVDIASRPAEVLADRLGKSASVLRDRADLQAFRAAKEETIARGNTGQGAQESAAFTAKSAADRAARAQAEAGSKLGNIENRAATEAAAPLTAFKGHLADVQAEQAAITKPFDQQVRDAQLEARRYGIARQALDRLPDASPEERPALLASLQAAGVDTSALNSTPSLSDTAAHLEQAQQAAQGKLADLASANPRGTGPALAEVQKAAEAASQAQQKAATLAATPRTEGLPNPADVAEQRFLQGRAELQGRAGDQDPRFYPAKVGEMAGSVAQQHVADALQADAEAGSRVAFARLTPDEKVIYKGEVGGDYATAKANRLMEARARVLDTMAERGRSAGQIEGQRIERANVAERAARLAERQAATAADKAAAKRAAEEVNPANAPARFRPAIQTGAKAVAATISHADEIAKTDPVAAQALRDGATRIPDTLKALVDAGVDPVHLIGGREEAGVGGAGQRGGVSLPKERALTSEKFKSEGTVPSDIATHDVRLRDRINRVYGNEAAPVVDAKIGTTAGSVPGLEGLKGREMAAGLREKGYTVWDPRNWRETMPEDLVKPGSRVIPTHLYNAFRSFYADRSLSPAAQTAVDFFDRGIRGGKGMTIALNPVAHFGFIVSDAIRHMAFGGIDPATYVARIAEAIREVRAQARTPEELYPAEALRGYGAQEKGLVDAAARRAAEEGKTGLLGGHHPFTTAVSKGYSIMDWSQRVQRLALYNENLSRYPPEQVLNETLKVAGDYRKLSDYEQGVVKRLIPGYDFYKNAAKTALKLPIDNPVRVAWLAHLAAVSAPANKNTPNWVNPLGALTSVPRLALPIEATGRLLGVSPSRAIGNIAKAPGVIAGTAKFSNPDLSAPNNQHGPLRTPGQFAHVLGGLLPQTKVAQALLQAPVGRYETGEPRPSTSQYGGPLAGGKLGEAARAGGLLPYPKAAPAAVLTSSGAGRGRGGSRGGRGGRGGGHRR